MGPRYVTRHRCARKEGHIDPEVKPLPAHRPASGNQVYVSAICGCNFSLLRRNTDKSSLNDAQGDSI